MTRRRKWLKRLLWLAGGGIAALLILWGVMLALMYLWVAKPPVLTATPAIVSLAPEKRARILPFIRAWGDAAEGLSGEAIFKGFSQIMAMRERGISATEIYDYVLSPTAPITAYAAELASPSDDPLNPFPHIGFTVAFNMTEQPAVSINCGFDEGLPIGLQIVGRRFDDVGVLSTAKAFEAMRAGEARAWPEPPGLRANRAN